MRGPRKENITTPSLTLACACSSQQFPFVVVTSQVTNSPKTLLCHTRITGQWPTQQGHNICSDSNKFTAQTQLDYLRLSSVQEKNHITESLTVTSNVLVLMSQIPNSPQTLLSNPCIAGQWPPQRPHNHCNHK